MKLQPLYDLQQEINRLFTAGSKFAKNDPRLQKQVAIFNKLGEKAPIFKKIAEGVENLAAVDSNESSSKLLEVSTLLYAVLYTQGETTDDTKTETEIAPMLKFEDVNTEKSYKALKPLIEALVDQKQGRLEVLKEAYKSNQFNDFRTYHLLDKALADRYSELADYVEKTIIPSIGAPMLPFIISNFSYEGNAEDVRRFRLLNKLEYSKIPEMIDEILGGKSILLQAEAVKILGKDANNEELLMNFAEDKQKPIRLAAYEALVNIKTETAQQKLVDLFINGKKKSDLSELSEALMVNLSDKFIPPLLEKAKESFNNCIALDKNSDIKIITKCFEEFKINMSPLLNNGNKEILDFYKDVFVNKDYIALAKLAESKGTYFRLPEAIAKSVANSLCSMPEGMETLKVLAEKAPCEAFMNNHFNACVKSGMDKKEVYKAFVNDIDRLLDSNTFHKAFRGDDHKIDINKVDPQWASVLEKKLPQRKEISLGCVGLYLELVGGESKKAQDILYKLMSSKQPDYTFHRLAEFIIKSKYPNVFELLFEMINKSAKSTKLPYLTMYSAGYIRQFPKEYADKFRRLGEFAAKSQSAYYSNQYYSAADMIEEANFGKE